MNDKHHAFVAIGMVLQDKVLSPVISDIERQQKSLSKEAERVEAQVHDLIEQLEDVALEDNQRATNEAERQTAEQRRDHLTEEQQENEALLKALVRFRGKLSS
jgi:flagellar capping protein FliD